MGGIIQWHMVVTGHLYLVYAVCDITIGCHSHISKPMFWRILLT